MEASWLCGLVDIGSNTIRGVIYQVKGSQFQEVASRCDFASLITFVEHDLLTSEGCTVLSESLGRMASFFCSPPLPANSLFCNGFSAGHSKFSGGSAESSRDGISVGTPFR